MKKEKLTYEILHEYKVKQDRLIAEGKMQRPQIIYGLSPQAEKVIKEGRTLDVVLKELEAKYGKI